MTREKLELAIGEALRELRWLRGDGRGQEPNDGLIANLESVVNSLAAMAVDDLLDYVQHKGMCPCGDVHAAAIHGQPACTCGLARLLANEEARHQEHVETRRQRDDFLTVLIAAKGAINPPDVGGISLHDWNARLKAATTQIEAVIARAGAHA